VTCSCHTEYERAKRAPGADLRRLKEAAQQVGFELRGAKVTPAGPGKTKPGWSEGLAGGGTGYVPLDPPPEP
jgi:hypothetical protein